MSRFAGAAPLSIALTLETPSITFQHLPHAVTAWYTKGFSTSGLLSAALGTGRTTGSRQGDQRSNEQGENLGEMQKDLS